MTASDRQTVRIVTLLTDFGLQEPYAGVMKGVILGIAPQARLVDLSHSLPPQAVLQAAFLLQTAWRYFPASTVHLVVADPGVGTSRRRLALHSQGHYFVGPDNGVLSSALPDKVRGWRRAGELYSPRQVSLPTGVEAIAIDVARLNDTVSATFEGRDVFAPTAARLANGASLRSLGDPVDSIETFAAFQAPSASERLDGVVLHADVYGNLMTDIRASDTSSTSRFLVRGRDLPVAHTYGVADGLCAIAGSSGYIEIALPNGSAALALGVGAGEPVTAIA